MKATELRIGNFVHYKSMISWVKLDIEDFRQLEYDIENKLIAPIKLTEEWLLNFGFKLETWKDKSNISDKVEEITGYVKDDIWCFLPLGEDKLRFFGRRIGNDRLWRFSEREGLHSINENNNLVIYVHKFQNLYFALTETELKIK